MMAYFYYPPAVTASILLYYDSSIGWAPVLSSGGQTPFPDQTPDLDGTTSGGLFTVVFDATSTPGINELSGTVFALAVFPSILPNSLLVSAGEFQFTVANVTPGSTIYVQASSDLSSPNNWISIATNVPATTNMTVSGFSTTNSAFRFFRVLETQ